MPWSLVRVQLGPPRGRRKMREEDDWEVEEETSLREEVIRGCVVLVLSMVFLTLVRAMSIFILWNHVIYAIFPMAQKMSSEVAFIAAVFYPLAFLPYRGKACEI